MKQTVILFMIGIVTACSPQNKKKYPMMDQRISVLSLSVKDLPALKKFYEEKLGWKPVAANKDIVFFKMNGFLFSLAKRELLQEFIGMEAPAKGLPAMIISYNVGSEDEVREIHDKLKGKGVDIVKAPTAPYFGGLFFYFKDIEGNVIEVAYNPLIPMDDKMNAIDHEPIDHL